jgi:branched-chain amino acid transport system substrate-binding protein
VHIPRKYKTVLYAIFILFVLVFIGLFFMSRFYLQSDTAEKEIKIGLVAPLTGSNHDGGISMLQGVELAVENINHAGGINGRKISLVVYDDENTPATCLSAVKRLIFIDNVKAIIGPFSSQCALEIQGLVNSCGIPLITPVAMADSLNEKDDYVFRNTLGVTAAQAKVNKFVNEKQNQYTLLDGFQAETIGIIWQDDFWGKAMLDSVLSDLKRLNREDALYFSIPFSLGQSDFSTFYSTRKDNFPDLIYIISSGSESISLVRQGREEGFKGIYIGEGGFNVSSFDEELGAYADGCVFSTQWHPSFSTPMSDVFLKSYKSKFREIPDMFAALSYESVYLLHDSLRKVIQSIYEDDFKDILRDNLSKRKLFSGLSGPIYLDSLGQADRDVFILQKRWDGNEIQAFIIYPTKYNQNSFKWNFEINE